MNPPLPEDEAVEKQLGELQPAALPGHLRHRLNAARAQVRIASDAQGTAPHGTRANYPWLRLAGWLGAGAAVLAVVFLSLREAAETMQSPPVATAKPILPAAGLGREFKPDTLDNFLVAAEPLDVVVAEDGRPYRLVRCTWIDRESYRDPLSDERVQLIQARNQIVPVALKFY